MNRNATSSYFVVSGTLTDSAACYVERPADAALLDALRQGELCYILDTRQVGKSSLIVRTAARLRHEAIRTAVTDISLIGNIVTVETWYYGLLHDIAQQFDIENFAEQYWLTNKNLGPAQRWISAIEAVLLQNNPNPLVIFIDEIDATRKLPFDTDEFFAIIRAAYNRRSHDSAFARLTFCLVGVAVPTDLISDINITPFNVGTRIELNDFQLPEMKSLAAGLSGAPTEQTKQLERVFYWTAGHPYLTQKLCRAIAATRRPNTDAEIDRICASLFFQTQAQHEDDNLVFVHRQLLDEPSSSLLDLYGRVLDGRGNDSARAEVDIERLRLAGVIRETFEGRDQIVRVRNRIYRRVFDRRWLNSNRQEADRRRVTKAYWRGVYRAAALFGSFAAALSALTAFAIYEKRIADRKAADAVTLSRIAGRRTMEKQAALEASARDARRATESALRAENLAKEARRQAANAIRAGQIAAKAQKSAQEAAAQERKMQLKATASSKLANHYLYVRNMNLFNRWWDESNISQITQYLQATRKSTDRDWEWNYWNRLCHLDEHTLTIEPKFSEEDKFPREDMFAQFVPGTSRALTLDNGPQERIGLWDTDRGVKVARLSAMTLPLACSSSAPLIAAANPDVPNRVELWHSRTLRHLGTLAGKRGTILCVAVSPDGSRVATTDTSNLVTLWDTHTLSELCTLRGHSATIRCAAFSPDGATLATGGDDGAVRLWNARSGESLQTPGSFDKTVVSVAFHPNNGSIAAGSVNGTIKLWSLERHEPPRTLSVLPDRLTSLAFSPDGRQILTGAKSSALRVYTSDTLQQVYVLHGHRGIVNDVAYSADGRKILSASYDGTVKVWSAEVRPELDSVQLGRYELLAMATSNDGKRLCACSSDHIVAVWDTTTGKVVHNGEHITTVCYAAAFFPGGHRLLLGFAGKMGGVYDLDSGRFICTLRDHTNLIDAVAVSADGNRFVTCGLDGMVNLYDSTTYKKLRSFDGGVGPIRAVAISNDGRRVVVGGTSGRITIWDAREGRHIRALRGQKDVVDSIAISLDQKYIAAVGWHSTGNVWDFRTGMHHATLNGHTSAVRAVAFTPNGNRIVTGSYDNTIRLWDTSSGQEMLTIANGNSQAACLALIANGTQIVCGGKDGTVRVWGFQPMKHPLDKDFPVP